MLIAEVLSSEFTAVEIDAAVKRYDFANPLFVDPEDVPESEWWEITHAAADASQSETEDAVFDAMEILEEIPSGELQELIEAGDFSGATNLFDWVGFEDELADNLNDVYSTIATRSGSETALEIGKGIDFDAEAVLDFFARGAKITAKRITANTRKAVNLAVRRLTGLGFSPFQVRAQLIELIGLDAQSMNAAINAISAAKEAGAKITEIKQLAEKLGEEKLSERLQRIARFENLNVAQAAQEEAVEQHVEARALKNVVKVWVVTPDERLCPICDRLRGQRKRKDQLFEDPFTGLEYIGPPAHQNCRCGLRYMQARRAEQVGVFVVDIRTPEGEQIILPSGVKVLFERFEFHLAGKHEQSRHGKGGGKGKKGKPRPSSMSQREYAALNNAEWDNESKFTHLRGSDGRLDWEKSPEAEKEISELFDRRRESDREWNADAKDAVTMGELDPAEASRRGLGTPRAQDWEELPDEVYHVTTASSAVKKEGLKTRDELGGDLAALGGGPSDTISFTDDEEIARGIERSMREARAVARNEITVDDMLEAAATGKDADKPYIEELINGGTASIATDGKWKEGDPLPRQWEILKEGRDLERDAMAYGAHQLKPGQRLEGNTWQGGDGNTYATAITVPMSQSRATDRRFQVYKRVSPLREAAGGPMDPLFFLQDTQHIGLTPKDEIKILKFKPSKKGVKGTRVSALGEWRTFTGAAVDFDEELPAGEYQGFAERDFPVDNEVFSASTPANGRNLRKLGRAALIADALAFHLAGKHDQSVHGRGGGKKTLGKPKVLPWKAPPPPQGGKGSKAGGFSATGRTNTMVGDTAEAALSQLGFESALPPGKRQGPFDVKCCNGWEFEVKAVTTDSTQYKIKMKGSELRSKKRAAKKRGVKAGSLIVVMDYKKGQAHAYWKEGLGNFRLNESWNYAGTAELGEAA